jgi:glycosyltransferase involved in cell wall biosynthesis
MVQDALEFARAEGIDVDKKKFFCLYNGFSAVNLVLDSLEEFLPPKKLRISYTGTIYLGKQDLTTLLHALSCLSEVERRGIEFVYAGPQADFVRRLVEEYHLSSCCCVLGEVSKETALQIQRSSDVLLLLKSDDDRGVFTGKYFEYLSSGKPILVLGDKDEEFNEVALSMGGIRIVPKGSEGAKEIVEILKALLTKDIDSQEGIWTLFGERKIEEVNRFHWDYLSRCLYERIVRDLEDGVFIT